MLRYFKFSSEVPAPVPAREVYGKPGPGQGWPSQCPPLRAAAAFGWDVLAAFEMVFRKGADGAWRILNPVDLESDWAWSPDAAFAPAHDAGGPHRANPHGAEADPAAPGPAAEAGEGCGEGGATGEGGAPGEGRAAGEGGATRERKARGRSGDPGEGPGEDDGDGDDGDEDDGGEEDEQSESDEGAPLVQRNAWFWERGQTLPHPISEHVYQAIRNQVKVSTYLFLATDPNEVLLLTDVPNLARPWRAMTALVETDWYPASYPWHCVLELDDSRSEIVVGKGEPICRLVPLRRDTYFAAEMTEAEFDAFFARTQAWLLRHGKGAPGEMMDIRGQYARQQQRSRFVVLP